MIIHTVYFWLKKELNEDQLNQFRNGLRTLTGITSAEQGYFGQKALTEPRPVVERTYDFGLTIILKDLAAQDAYQADPEHRQFVEDCAHMWEKVVVYDVQSEE